jgi:predicted CoA-binding protein
MTSPRPSDDDLRRILSSARTVALVGASSNIARASHAAMQSLLDAGFTVIPVTLADREVLGQQAYRSISDGPVPVDIVSVFRRAEEAMPLVEEAIETHARVFWLDAGISSHVAESRGRSAGLEVVMDISIVESVQRLGVRAPGA